MLHFRSGLTSWLTVVSLSDEHERLYNIDAIYYCNLRRPISLSNSQNLVCYKVLLFFNMLPGTVNICKNCMLCREWCVELARK